MSNLNFHDFGKRNHFLGGDFILENLQVKLCLSDAGDAFAGEIAAIRFDVNQHVFVRIAEDDAEETSQLGFKEPAIKGEVSALVNNGCG